MELTSPKKSKLKSLYILIGLVCLTVFAGLVYWQYQKPERKSDANDQNKNTPSENTQPTDNTGSASTLPVSQAEGFYLQGSEKLTAKNYAEAIKYFDQAIAADAYEPQYYSDKSEAQYNLGDKQAAIATLKQGSSLNPDSDLLKSKIDILTKDQFSNPSIDTPRE